MVHMIYASFIKSSHTGKKGGWITIWRQLPNFQIKGEGEEFRTTLAWLRCFVWFTADSVNKCISQSQKSRGKITRSGTRWVPACGVQREPSRGSFVFLMQPTEMMQNVFNRSAGSALLPHCCNTKYLWDFMYIS